MQGKSKASWLFMSRLAGNALNYNETVICFIVMDCMICSTVLYCTVLNFIILLYNLNVLLLKDIVRLMFFCIISLNTFAVSV